MTEATLGFGGNLGDPVAAIHNAVLLLEAGGARLAHLSSFYRTPAWGKTDQPDFVNAAAAVETALSPQELLVLCLSVERQLGRVRLERWGPRGIDIDLLTFGDLTVADADLVIPHPLMLERGFVLIPLAEIRPDLILGGKRIAEHAARFAHEAIVRLDVAGETGS